MYQSTSICLYSGESFKNNVVPFEQPVGQVNVFKFKIEKETNVIFKLNQMQKRVLQNEKYEAG